MALHHYSSIVEHTEISTNEMHKRLPENVVAGRRSGSTLCSRRRRNLSMKNWSSLLLLLCFVTLACCMPGVKAYQASSLESNAAATGKAPNIDEGYYDEESKWDNDKDTNDDMEEDEDDDEEDDDDEEKEIQPRWPPKSEHKRMSIALGDFHIDEPTSNNDSNENNNAVVVNTNDPRQAADWYLDQLLDTSRLRHRLAQLFSKTKTAECRQKIATHLGYFLAAIGKEEEMPFARTRFTNTCPEPVYDDWTNLPPDMHVGMIQNRSYKPPRSEAVYIGDPNDLQLLYIILTHNDAPGTIRLIEALYEKGHAFVVHVDAKEASQETYDALRQYVDSLQENHVHLVPDPFRVRITWGGFSMVNATLQALQYSFGLLRDENNEPVLSQPLDFDKVVHLASTSYPLASNTEIRHRLASFPLDANFMHVIMKPVRPWLWNYFVECDDTLHRLHHLPVLQNATAGANLFTSSQWWIISREFAEYLARAGEGTFVHQFLDYVEHVVVADETFFGTVLRHTEFCLKHHNRNFLHLQFDRWESDLPKGQRDEQKCMMKDPNKCGRSPTTMTVDYADILELSDDLFARKFVDSRDSKVKDIVDAWRAKREESIQAYLAESSKQQNLRSEGMDFEGHGVLIVAKESANDKPLCMALGESSNEIKLVPCFHEWVIPNLLEKWESGAVVLAETLPHNRWEMTPCTTDGTLERDNDTGSLKVTPGNYSVTGPRCMLKQMDGIRSGRCFDGDTGNASPGGEAFVFPCVQRWGQFLSVGDGRVAPEGSLFFHIPKHIVGMLASAGTEQHAFLCLSVAELNDEAEPIELKSQRPMTAWEDHPIISIPCTDEKNVIEWVFVPYIQEDLEEDATAEVASSSSTVENSTASANESPDAECTTS